jgi:hypothetical protein
MMQVVRCSETVVALSRLHDVVPQQLIFIFLCHDSSVDIAPCYGLDSHGTVSERIPEISLFHSAWSDCKGYYASCPMGTGGSSPG